MEQESLVVLSVMLCLGGIALLVLTVVAYMAYPTGLDLPAWVRGFREWAELTVIGGLWLTYFGVNSTIHNLDRLEQVRWHRFQYGVDENVDRAILTWVAEFRHRRQREPTYEELQAFLKEGTLE